MMENEEECEKKARRRKRGRGERKRRVLRDSGRAQYRCELGDVN